MYLTPPTRWMFIFDAIYTKAWIRPTSPREVAAKIQRIVDWFSNDLKFYYYEIKPGQYIPTEYRSRFFAEIDRKLVELSDTVFDFAPTSFGPSRKVNIPSLAYLLEGTVFQPRGNGFLRFKRPIDPKYRQNVERNIRWTALRLHDMCDTDPFTRAHPLSGKGKYLFLTPEFNEEWLLSWADRKIQIRVVIWTHQWNCMTIFELF